MAKGTKFVDFGGERIEVPADSNPRTAGQASMLRQKMLKERRASAAPTTSPRPAPRPQATGTPGNSQRASSTPPSRSQRPSNSQGVSGDPRTSDGYNRIGASNPGTQRATGLARNAYETGRAAVTRSSQGGPARYSGYERTYKDAEEANDAQLAYRSRAFARGRKTNRNAAAVREMVRRDNKTNG